MTLVLGLTGSIATGKSTVVSIFRSYGFPIVDGDQVAREIVQPGKPALKAITSHFGLEMIRTNGELDRKKLGALIFSQPEKRQELDQLLDSFLRDEIVRQIEEKKKMSTLVIADIPLLFERNYQSEVDQIAVVYAPQEIQQARLIARDGLTKAQAFERIASQMSIEVKKKQADIIFDNQGSPLETKNQVVDWLKKQQLIAI